MLLCGEKVLKTNFPYGSSWANAGKTDSGNLEKRIPGLFNAHILLSTVVVKMLNSLIISEEVNNNSRIKTTKRSEEEGIRG